MMLISKRISVWRCGEVGWVQRNLEYVQQKVRNFKHPVFGWLRQLDYYKLYYKCIQWHRCHYWYVRRCRTECCGHCKRVSIQLRLCRIGISFGKNDESYFLVPFHNDDSPSSHKWIAWWIVHVIRNLFVACCPSILERNAASMSIVPVVVFFKILVFQLQLIF